MEDNLSKETRKIWDLMMQSNKEVYSTADLLRCLVNLNGGMFSIILDDYKISKDEINEYLDNTLVMDYSSNKYTKKLMEVYDFALNVAEKNNEEIYEEHLIYALLKVKDTIAYDVLKYYIKDLEKLSEEYNQIFDLESIDTILINLTKVVRTKKEKFIGRCNLIDRVVNILNKKKKNNPLLIGSAGVGKSSVVEEVARYYLKKHPEYTIYQLDVSQIISGTKYRGDLEEKLLNVIEQIKKPYTILFIDEIHNIIKQNEESQSMDIGNMLKPILSRGEISLIGATTLDEYYESINTDKALARRFSNVFIDEASPSETFSILKGIKKDYEKHYKVKYSDKVLKYIILKSKLILNRHLPDKAIDILDESGLVCKVQKHKEVIIDDVDKVVFNFIGQDIDNIKDNLNKKIKYPRLKYYINNYLLGVFDKKQIGVFKVDSAEVVNEVINDLKNIFNLKDEMILEINMIRYKTTFELSNLFGSSKGYVGYNSGGLISEHLIKYPFSVIIIKNLSEVQQEVQNQVESIIKNGEFTDNKSRKVSLKNTIIILEEKTQDTKYMGFIGKTTEKSERIFDEEFKNSSHDYTEDLLELLNNLSYHNYNFSYCGKELHLEEFDLIKGKLLNISHYEKNKLYLINEDGLITT